MKLRRPFRAALACAILGTISAMFIAIIWIPLYRDPARAHEEPIFEVEIVKEDGSTWTVNDPKAVAKLRAGLKSAPPAAEPAPPPPPSEERYLLRIRGPQQIEEYDVVLGPEGRTQDRAYMIRRSGGTSTYGTAYNTPELRSTLQRVLTPVK